VAPIFSSWIALSVLCGAACSDDPQATSAVTHPTLIEVAPTAFLGAAPCTAADGAVRRYVATLIDITDEDGDGGAPAEPFTLPSSPPTDCRASVGFGAIVDRRRYRAEVDAYDRDDLAPRVAGGRQMLAADGTLVEPRWQTRCADAGVIATGERIVSAQPCRTLSTSGSAGLLVETSAILGALECGAEAGQVARMAVTLEGAEPRSVEVTCGDPALLADLPARAQLELYVEAFTNDAVEAIAGAECSARTTPGVSVTASCARLSEVGTLRIDFAEALGKLGTACTEVSDVVVQTADDDPVHAPPPDCLVPLAVTLRPGPAAVTVEAFDARGASRGLVTCTRVVAAGKIVEAQCAVE
jgi:hypothetical protein